MSWGSCRRLAIVTIIGAALGAPLARAAARAAPRAAAASPRESVRLYLPDAFFVDRQAVTVPRRETHVTGFVSPYVAGQKVEVGVIEGRRRVKTAVIPILRNRSGHNGHFSDRFTLPSVGDASIVVKHHRDAAMGGFEISRTLISLDEHVGFGARGRFVLLIQQQLAALHFFVPRSGVYDAGTGVAIDAYHRLLGWGTSQNLDGRTVSFLLDGFGAFHVRYPGHGRHAEANLGRQLLALIVGAHVYWIIPVSSGKPSTPTVLGDFHVYQRQPGYNQKLMFYSDYFFGNYAIHGYDPAPDFPASHGCIRIPIADAIPVFNWLALGDWVDVYS
jgi:hypothetical protein